MLTYLLVSKPYCTRIAQPINPLERSPNNFFIVYTFPPSQPTIPAPLPPPIHPKIKIKLRPPIHSPPLFLCCCYCFESLTRPRQIRYPGRADNPTNSSHLPHNSFAFLRYHMIPAFFGRGAAHSIISRPQAANQRKVPLGIRRRLVG